VVYYYLNSSTFVTAFHSKLASSNYEWDMYLPFVEALNHALEQLSSIQVDGLPGFKNHIAFVPCNKGVSSRRNLPGSSFKPDIALMSIQGAREIYELDGLDASKASRFASEIAGKSPSGFTGWETILSAIEVKRKKDMSGWAFLEAFGQEDRQVGIIRDADQRLDETLDDSQPTTRKISVFSWVHMLNDLHSGLICNLGVLQAVRERS
jgi:hypothetical protein